MRFSVNAQLAEKIKCYGKTVRTGSVTVKYFAHKDYRYSPVISKKQGNAVKRNSVKRLIRNIMTSNKKHYPKGLYLIYFNGQCNTINRENLIADLSSIMNKILT